MTGLRRNGDPYLTPGGDDRRRLIARDDPTIRAALLHRLTTVDRGLFLRLALRPGAPTSVQRLWIAITHLGGAVMTIGSVVVPGVFGLVAPRACLRAGAALALSHLVVQAAKRLVGRQRPSGVESFEALIRHPDRFSFPSGHATSSLAVTLSYGLAWPVLAVPLATLGLLIGWSRVVLRVHYPGDVVAGQLIAAATVLALPA